MCGLLPGLDVSRETSEKLQLFADLLRRWTRKINLISPKTVDEIWDRHIVDSAQIYALAPNSYNIWTDLGSGGGLPGIVCAAIASERSPKSLFTLIESDQRKATFLRAAVRELDLNAKVIVARIETAFPQVADVVSARGLTGLPQLLPFLQRHLSPDGQAILHKGRRHQEETIEARKSWVFSLEEHVSFTDPDARLLQITGVTRLG